jgi:hypothetical protein
MAMARSCLNNLGKAVVYAAFEAVARIRSTCRFNRFNRLARMRRFPTKRSGTNLARGHRCCKAQHRPARRENQCAVRERSGLRYGGDQWDLIVFTYEPFPAYVERLMKVDGIYDRESDYDSDQAEAEDVPDIVTSYASAGAFGIFLMETGPPIGFFILGR